jgi:hypothetical protein
METRVALPGVPGGKLKVSSAEVIAVRRVQAVACIPVIAAAAKHGSLLSLSAALSPAGVAAAANIRR